MKKLLFAAVALGILTSPSFGQRLKDDDPLIILEKEKKAQSEQVDRQYKRTLEQTRKENAAAASNDPWANMRAPNEKKR